MKVVAKTARPDPTLHICERPTPDVLIRKIGKTWAFVSPYVVAYTIFYCPFCGTEL
jgi:hypothetical protein